MLAIVPELFFMSTILLLQIAIIILICIGLSSVSSKLGAPTLLVILLLGLLFGNHGFLSIGYIGYDLAQRCCETALIFIMFYGGFATRWDSVKPVFMEAGLLSTLGVPMMAGMIGAFCHFAIGWDWPQSLLLGAILSSTDAASVFAIFKSRRLNLKGETAQLIEVESGSNDPMAHMLTLAMISVLNGKGEGIGLVWNVILEIALGVGLGILIAKVAALVLKNLKFKTEGLNSLFIFAVAILSFSMPDSLGGNGYLSVYIVGLLIGNEDFLGKKSLVHFFDGLTGLMENSSSCWELLHVRLLSTSSCFLSASSSSSTGLWFPLPDCAELHPSFSLSWRSTRPNRIMTFSILYSCWSCFRCPSREASFRGFRKNSTCWTTIQTF